MHHRVRRETERQCHLKDQLSTAAGKDCSEQMRELFLSTKTLRSNDK